ncbi:MAG: ABC transporter permease [Reyranellaceae bacterium]
MSRRLRPALRRWQLAALSLALALGLWELLGRGGDPIMSSYPTAVLAAIGRDIASGHLLRAIVESLPPLVIGYSIAVCLGIPLGILLGRSKRAEAMLGFYFVGLDASPIIAFVPLFILWFGLGTTVKIAMVVVFCITPVVINCWRGVRGVPSSLVEVGKSFGASRGQIAVKIVLPAALPSILTGLRLAIGRAIIATAVAEIFTALSGLGGLLLRRSESYDTAGSLVPALVLMAMGIGFTSALGALEKRLLSWFYDQAEHQP